MNPIDYWYQKYVALKAEVDRAKAREVEVVIEDIEPELDEPYPVIPVGHLGYCVGDRVRITIHTD